MTSEDAASTETPRLLPTLVPGPSEELIDRYDVVQANLTIPQLQMLIARGLWIQDVLDGKVPGLDPDEIIADAQPPKD